MPASRTYILSVAILLSVSFCLTQDIDCQKDADCPLGAFCFYPAGTCTAGEGAICQPVPADCRGWPKSVVCGCDGQDYANACYASQNKTSVYDTGRCSQKKTCSSNSDCKSDSEYCQLPFGKCGSQGTCAERPEMCTMHYDPVCGCDGRTYGNACSAASNRQSISKRGEC